MTSFWIVALILTALLYGTRSSIRTFRHEMAYDRKVWLVVICGGVVASCLLTGGTP
jgi:hypothetical protein